MDKHQSDPEFASLATWFLTGSMRLGLRALSTTISSESTAAQCLSMKELGRVPLLLRRMQFPLRRLLDDVDRDQWEAMQEQSPHGSDHKIVPQGVMVDFGRKNRSRLCVIDEALQEVIRLGDLNLDRTHEVIWKCDILLEEWQRRLQDDLYHLGRRTELERTVSDRWDPSRFPSEDLLLIAYSYSHPESRRELLREEFADARAALGQCHTDRDRATASREVFLLSWLHACVDPFLWAHESWHASLQIHEDWNGGPIRDRRRQLLRDLQPSRYLTCVIRLATRPDTFNEASLRPRF